MSAKFSHAKQFRDVFRDIIIDIADGPDGPSQFDIGNSWYVFHNQPTPSKSERWSVMRLPKDIDLRDCVSFHANHYQALEHVLRGVSDNDDLTVLSANDIIIPRRESGTGSTLNFSSRPRPLTSRD